MKVETTFHWGDIMEKWRKITDTMYSVSNRGNVRNDNSGKRFSYCR